MVQLLIEKRAIGDLRGIPEKNKKIIFGKIKLLAENQFLHNKNTKILKGAKLIFRLRVGDYRVLYRIGPNQIYIFAIKHRKDVYQP